MIKRYECTTQRGSHDDVDEAVMEANTEGDYVKYEDVKVLIEALKYYADKNQYSTDYASSENGFIRRCILYGDIEEINQSHGVGGRRAREALTKLGIKLWTLITHKPWGRNESNKQVSRSIYGI